MATTATNRKKPTAIHLEELLRSQLIPAGCTVGDMGKVGATCLLPKSRGANGVGDRHRATQKAPGGMLRCNNFGPVYDDSEDIGL